MKDIKFRAWDGINKKWAHFDDKVEIAGETDRPWAWICAEDEYHLHISSDMGFEVNQYTGLKDKNKKESYWDDIVSDGINPSFIITPDYHLLARLSEIEFEVIGNIHENPELK